MAELSLKNLERVQGWGGAVCALSNVFRPESVEGVQDVLELARRSSRPVAMRGGGQSYGDASLVDKGIVLDLSKMDKVLAWDPETGIADLEPGVTIEKLWKHIIADGYWPPVVSGTMYTTMGGCAAMNIHGKNNFCQGTFGEHILELDVVFPDGTLKTVKRDLEDDLFLSLIGGLGMLGVITRLQMKMKKIYSGRVCVEAFNTPNIAEMINAFELMYAKSDYLVGWVDTTATGSAVGRNQVHRANYLPEGRDADPKAFLHSSAQGLPANIMGIFPKKLMHLLFMPFCNNIGMRLVNMGKYYSGQLMPQHVQYLQTHAAFNFLLDYVPDWKLAYGKKGLIQYQSFIPKESAAVCHTAIIKRAQEVGIPAYLGVFKKHRPDPFLMTHSVDGYSMALDFKVTDNNRAELWKLTHELNAIVLDAGGKFYFAKDLTMPKGTVNRFIPEENMRRFLEQKHACDPTNLLQTELTRRIFENS